MFFKVKQERADGILSEAGQAEYLNGVLRASEEEASKVARQILCNAGGFTDLFKSWEGRQTVNMHLLSVRISHRSSQSRKPSHSRANKTKAHIPGTSPNVNNGI